MQNKVILLTLLTGISLIGCSGSGSGSSTSSGITPSADQTYGGVNKPASAQWWFQNTAKTTSGIIRLTNNESGIIFLSSQESSSNFDLKGTVTNFAMNQANCLPSTPVTGTLNKANVESATISLANCAFSESQISALVSVNVNGQNVYSESASLATANISSTATVTELSSQLLTTPINYNHNVNLSTKFVATLDGFNGLIGDQSGSFALGGILFGNLSNDLVSTSPLSVTLSDGITSNIAFSMVDSTSVNANATITNNGHSTLVQCNLLFADLVADGNLNNDTNAFITGCSGSIANSDGSTTSVGLSGNLNIK